MTLGGLAVAMGELVDDAIVDVENIYKRLRENATLAEPRSPLVVVYDASREVRSSIIMSTVVVALIFAPLFALSGMEGRLFSPLGVAYLVSIVASTLVSLTVTPCLSYYLLVPKESKEEPRDGFTLRTLKMLITPIINSSMHKIGFVSYILVSFFLVAIAGIILAVIGKNFLPSFDEGAMQVNLFMSPGTSLETSREMTHIANLKLNALIRDKKNPKGFIEWYTCRTGRAENDEHIMGVNVSEYVITLSQNHTYTREEMIEKLHHSLEDLPGVEVEVEQPIAHLISHMLSGVNAQIAIKLYGEDFATLRRKAEEIKSAIADVSGIAPPVVEPLMLIPQLRIELKKDQLAYYGLVAADINEMIETALNGRIVSEIIEGQKTFDLVVRFQEKYRKDFDNLERLPIELASGIRIPLSEVAKIYETKGPNTINREDGRRRIVVRVNTMGRDLESAVSMIKKIIEKEVVLPEGYFVVYSGQFEAQKSATKTIVWLSLIAAIGVFFVLYSSYPSFSIVFQILLAIPAAFVGGVAAMVITQQSLSVASMVGFISLGGIAIRNGLLLMSSYLSEVESNGFTKEAIREGSMSRLAPVLMTALTTGLALIPLVIGGNLPGKEILYPVATVIVGGLITSTLTEFLLRPGMFWFLGKNAAHRIITQNQAQNDHDF